jgi:hydrogenase maturation protein HypF
MDTATTVRRRVLISGVVQGVGFRPFVWRRATRFGLAGWVENAPAGVVVEVQGDPAAVAAFLTDLAAQAPPLAAVTRIDVADVPVRSNAPAAFAILASRAGGRRSADVPPDIAPCQACLAELADPKDRRFRYPFINCTDCGPRFTIIEDLPYDRLRTTMRRFAMCGRCAAEYAEPAARRFHAEPIACPACGPTVWFACSDAGPVPTSREAASVRGDDALTAARRLLADGGILAVKGVGGFHLACDATRPAAVASLRDRKHRVGKPFAVMVTDAAAAATLAVVSDQERGLLEGRERPIVLLRARSGAALAPEVAPGLDVIGLMLPPTPLHHLLAAYLPPLVMTSGNLAEEPIAHDDADAVARLAPLVDGFLLHDRPIHVPCDDSVVRCVAGAAVPIRRSRGHAPLPVRVAGTGPTVLAVGGELKATACLLRDGVAFMSQHLGDMGNLETLAALDRAADHLLGLFSAVPEAVVADLHPGYLSADWAARFAAARGIPLVRVQHHEAHVAALLGEHGFAAAAPPAGFIAACFDGTGFGRDGTIQGGEFFVVTDGRLRRSAHLLPFPLPGGDAAIRHPWRTALAVLHAAGLAADDRLPIVGAIARGDRAIVARQLELGLNTTPTTSMGRLFDAVASLTGVAHAVTYEAEAAMKLEAIAALATADTPLDPCLVTGTSAGDPLVVDWRPTIASLVARVCDGADAATVAAGFHAAVAGLVVDTCRLLRGAGAGGTVGLTGGVFQNALLTERTIAALRATGFDVLTHHAVPPNDGGLALGQALLARDAIRGRRTATV